MTTPPSGRSRSRGAQAPDSAPAPALASPVPVDVSKYETRVVPIGKVKRYHRNPRRHEKGIQKLALIIQETGFRQPILVDKDHVIILGEGRHIAAELLGLPAVPVWVADDLTDDQIRTLRIADNRVHEESSWDYGKLGIELDELLSRDVDPALTGFDKSELDRILATDADAPLEPVDVQKAPRYGWVLVGIPLERYHEIAEHVETISQMPDVFCEVTASNQDPAGKPAPR